MISDYTDKISDIESKKSKLLINNDCKSNSMLGRYTRKSLVVDTST